MANENRDIPAVDRSAFAAYGVDFKNEDLRTEYFAELDLYRSGQKVGPMPEWMIWPLIKKYQKKPEAPKPAGKKTPQLIS